MDIITKKLIIRPVQIEDTQSLYQIRNHEFVQLYNAMKEPTYENVKKEITQKSDTTYVIIEKENQVIIGEIEAQTDSLRYGVSSLIISYYLDKNYSRKGYMYEALHAFLQVLFDSGVPLVTARCFKENMASIALLKKLGFIQEGCLRHAVMGYHNIIHDDCLFSIMPNELKEKD